MKKRAVCLIALMSAMTMALTGCSVGNSVNNSAEAANVDGVSIPLGEVNFYLRYQQTQMSMYSGYFGEDFMNQDLTGTGSVYGETVKDTVVQTLEEYYLVEAHAEEIGISLTDEDKAAAEEAADAFLAANDSKTLQAMSADKETVTHVLELMALQSKAYADRAATIDTNVTDEEAAQKTITYVRSSTNGTTDDEGNTVDLTDEELAAKKDVLNQIRDEAGADGDLDAAAENHDLSAVTTSYGADDENLNEDVKAAAETLSDGEYADIVEGDNAYYLIRMDSTFDREATDNHKQVILTQRKSDAYTAWVDSLKENAEITTNDDALAELTFERVFTQTSANTTDDSEDTSAEDTSEDTATEDVSEDAAADDASEGTDENADSADGSAEDEAEENAQ